MSKKNILSIGLELAGDNVQFCKFSSDTSLLDWDIILFKADIQQYFGWSETYNGKPCLDDSSSFKLKERAAHWRREIREAISHGKTVIVFLSELEEVYIATGQKTYSGTGRNQKTTRMVTEFDNYQCIPVDLKPIKSNGKSIILSRTNSGLIAPYWKEFGPYSEYKTIIASEKITPCLQTKSGDKVVGAIHRPQKGTGALVLFPDIEFYDESFFDEKDGKNYWNKEAIKFSKIFVNEIVSLDRALKSDGEQTPEPDWAKSPDFLTDKEKDVASKLISAETRLEKLQAAKQKLLDQLSNESRLRGLLFEKGKPLENAVLVALTLLGFKADQYSDAESEFDAVFTSEEGRFLGEAEGKDNKPINIEKLRQLALNIHEDLEKEGVDAPAKGVLFGNPFRLQEPSNRNEAFTEKCLSASSTSSTALVYTPDLFEVALYLSNTKDKVFAKRCRKAMLSTVGRVKFPKPKKPSEKESEEVGNAT